MFKISYSLDFLNNVSFVNVHHCSINLGHHFCKQLYSVPLSVSVQRHLETGGS